MKNTFLTLALTTLILSVFAQNATDALRYSSVNYFGTARSMAMGGAFGAVGADFSVMSTNPAGLGLYKTAEFTVTPFISLAETKSGYFGSAASDDKYNFAFSSVGGVLAAEYPNRLETPGDRKSVV